MKTPSKAGLLIAIGGVLAVVMGLVLKYGLGVEIDGLVVNGMAFAVLGASIQILTLAESNLAAIQKACCCDEEIKHPLLVGVEVTQGTPQTDEIKIKQYSFKPK